MNAYYKQKRKTDRFSPELAEIAHMITFLRQQGTFRETLHIERSQLPGFSSKTPGAKDVLALHVVDTTDACIRLWSETDQTVHDCPFSVLLGARESLTCRLDRKDATYALQLWGPDEAELGARRPAELLDICPFSPGVIFTLDGDASNMVQFARLGARHIKIFERRWKSALFMKLLAQAAVGTLWPETQVDVQFAPDAKEHLVPSIAPLHKPALLYMDFLGHPQDWVQEIWSLWQHMYTNRLPLMVSCVFSLRNYVSRPLEDRSPEEVDLGLFLQPLHVNQICGMNRNMRMSTFVGKG